MQNHYRLLALLAPLSLSAGCGSRTALGLEDYLSSAERPAGGSTGAGASGGLGTGASGGSVMGTGAATSAGGSSSIPEPPVLGCHDVPTQQFDPATMVVPYRAPAEVEAQVDNTLAMMAPAQKYAQMTGVHVGNKDYRDIERSPDVEVTGVGMVRGFRYRSGGRGLNLESLQDNRPDDVRNFATAFPAPSLRAASWDLVLERRVGAAIGDETVASKNNVLVAPCMNAVRHPYWGRTQETYGEDPYHLGRMATAFAVGVQEYVAACAKSFAVNNIEKDRAGQNAVVSEQALRESYGRHFGMVVEDAGVACILAGYNSVNGTHMTQNEHLLREILKAPVEQGGMGFDGFVLSEWWAMPGNQNMVDSATAQSLTHEAVRAGTDIEMPWQLHYSATTLGSADQALVDDAVRRILTQKFRFKSALSSDGWGLKSPSSTLTEGSIAPNAMHEDLAEQSAIESAVLLTNGLDSAGPVLPLDVTASIAVVGRSHHFELVSSSVPYGCHAQDPPQSTVRRKCDFEFATDPALGDRGNSRVNADPERAVGPFEGIRRVAGEGATVESGNSVEAAAHADTVVVVVGYTPGDEGEEYAIRTGGDRSSLDLPPGHNELVMGVLDLDKPTVIIIESGSVVNLPWLAHANRKQATIWAGYPGMRGGLALGKLIFGAANFSGKMPLAWPAEHELPPFKDEEKETTMGYYFGYREFDRRMYVQGQGVELVFPFGHGLSYASFEYSNLSLPCANATKEAVFNVTVDITNTSRVDGDEVAMLFVKPPPKPSGVTGERPWKELKSFVRMTVPAGRTVTAELPLRIRDLRRWEGGPHGRWVLDSGEYTILVGKNAADAETTSTVAALSIEGY